MPDTPNEATAPNRWDPYGPNANADETRQAQHMEANDAPLDVNMNAVVGREQALTFTVAGQSFQANNDVRQKLQDRILAKLPV